MEPSDEEVLADFSEDSVAEDDDGSDEDDPVTEGPRSAIKLGRSGTKQGSDSEESSRPHDDEEAGGWGTSRRDYYNADAIETEADALEEEAEAIRLQKKQLEGLTEADFGFDEAEWTSSGKVDGQDNDDEKDTVKEVLPDLEITDAMGPDERTRLLTARYPEFQPLAKEFIELQGIHEDLQLEASAASSVEAHLRHKFDYKLSNGAMSMGASIASIKYSAVTAYLAALSMYFAIFSSLPEDENGKTKAINSTDLRDHPIMETLIRCRELWEKVRDVRNPEPAEQAIAASQDRQLPDENPKPSTNGLDGSLSVKAAPVKKKKKRKSKAQLAAEAALIESNQRRAERIQQTEDNLKQLSTLKFISPEPKKAAGPETHLAEVDESDFGEETSLTAHEAAEKARQKKSLRFYTSQITQKANKRDAAGRDAGGDADVPYRERLKDKQARLNAEAEVRGKRIKDTKGDILGGESDEEDHKTAIALRNEGGDEDYYDLVAARLQKKKAAKAALSAAHQQAAKEGGTVQIVEEVGPDGKRGITYAIEKNKGLTPKRKKDVRNPRVKKRKKYEEKKKKLGSIRQVYKGGEGRGGYGGELTGIKKGLIRSIKL